MLNEGWDVLNLFDIVRLYDIRDGKKQKMVLNQVKQQMQKNNLLDVVQDIIHLY